MTLANFLLARIAEDEAVIREPQFAALAEPIDREQLLAECEAKREIVRRARYYELEWEIAIPLAAIYADHPDYREEWKAVTALGESV